MLLWTILMLMTAATAVWLSAPLLRDRGTRHEVAASELEIYRDQLGELEREQSDGAIDAAQAMAAGVEIKRRLLNAASSKADVGRPLSLAARHLTTVAVTGVIAIGSMLLYANVGRPELPSASRAATQLVRGGDSQEPTFRAAAAGAAALPAAQPTQVSAATPAGSNQALGSVDEMIERLVQRLKKQPGDVETWRMLGWSHISIGHYPEGAEAYRKATELQPDNATLLASYGEALVRVADGEVGAQAKAIFDRALALDASEPRARYFRGLAQQQSGNGRDALESWIALLGDGEADGAWGPDLRGQIVELAAQLGVDVSTRLPAAPDSRSGGILQALKERGEPPPAAPHPSQRGPSAQEMAAADQMDPAQRSAMIRGMVDGLAARLEKSPRDADGWIQLMRSRTVLGETEAAKAALAGALAVFKDAPEEQARITAAAAGIGIAR